MATEKDVAFLNLAGLSTRMLAQMSGSLLGIRVSAKEVSNALATIVPAAKAFLTRPLGDRKWIYLYVDGTNFRVRRSTVGIEPTLVVLGRRRNRQKKRAFHDSRRQGQSPRMGVGLRRFEGARPRRVVRPRRHQDGLPGLGDAFREAFSNAKVLRCWVHKARNVMPLVPRRYQAAFQVSWNLVAYAENLEAAHTAFGKLKTTWKSNAANAVERMEKDLDALLAHYMFPSEHWDALRTTNPIERVNKEFKRRSKAMEVVGPNGLNALLAFTAIRLESRVRLGADADHLEYPLLVSYRSPL